MSNQIEDSFDDWSDSEAPLEKGEALVLSIDGFEGPLDLLLALSRTRKIDLKAISIAELAGQYISYIEDLRKHRLEIAADYLVMAAWLTFLKSKLLLPVIDDGSGELSGDELAARLAFRLKRLDAMRTAANELMAQSQLGRDFFGAGSPEGFTIVAKHQFKADSYQLFKAYADLRTRDISTDYKVKRRKVWSIKKARTRLQSLLGMPIDWAPIDQLIMNFLQDEELEKTTIASTFGATLEMARDGVIELRQAGHFEPIYVKSCAIETCVSKTEGQPDALDDTGGADER